MGVSMADFAREICLKMQHFQTNFSTVNTLHRSITFCYHKSYRFIINFFQDDTARCIHSKWDMEVWQEFWDDRD